LRAYLNEVVLACAQEEYGSPGGEAGRRAPCA